MAKSASLQPNGFGIDGATTKKSSKDTLSTCDSSSEVSDEGYKSSQVNILFQFSFQFNKRTQNPRVLNKWRCYSKYVN